MSTTKVTTINRRTALVHAMVSAGCMSGHLPSAMAMALQPVANVSGLYTVRVARIIAPRSAQEVVDQGRAWPGRIAVGGGRYSMGGQVAVANGLHLDMRQMNQLVWLDVAAHTVRVQAGMRWRDLQDLLDPHGLGWICPSACSRCTRSTNAAERCCASSFGVIS